MSSIFFISDTHFGHANTFLKFKLNDGVTPLRPFTSIEEMNETMVRNWNNVVRPDDKVYHLGDVVINKKYLDILNRCMGRKRLIRGNHDLTPTKKLMEYFDEIYGVRVLNDVVPEGMILSHVPLHRGSVIPRMGCNVHGHLHGNDIPDGAYYSVCVENINYAPIELSVLRQKIKEKKEKYWNLDYEGKAYGNGPG